MEVTKSPSNWEKPQVNQTQKTSVVEFKSANIENNKLDVKENVTSQTTKDSVSTCKIGSADIKNFSFIDESAPLKNKDLKWAKNFQEDVKCGKNIADDEKVKYGQVYNKYQEVEKFKSDFSEEDLQGKEIPHLKKEIGDKIAQKLGKSDVKELQKDVGTLQDGKYGADTHKKVNEKYKAYSEDELNKALYIQKKALNGGQVTDNEINEYTKTYSKMNKKVDIEAYKEIKASSKK